MTDLVPDPDTGLAYLSSHVEEVGYTPTDLRKPGAYAIRISIPDTQSVEAYERAFREHYDHTPPFVEELADADRCYYVGESGDIYDRLDDHVEGKVRQALLPTVFEIHSLKTVWFADSESKDDRETAERTLARTLQAAEPSAYVHYR